MTNCSIGAIILLAVQACSSSTHSKPANSPDANKDPSSLIDDKAENEDKAILERRECLGDSNKPKECESNEDCCEGFYCGRDPQVSDVMKVCIASTP